jgi:hypothetical protein
MARPSSAACIQCTDNPYPEWKWVIPGMGPISFSEGRHPAGSLRNQVKVKGIVMFASLEPLFISLGIAAYVSAHAYVLLVLKAPAARRAHELSRRRS